MKNSKQNNIYIKTLQVINLIPFCVLCYFIISDGIERVIKNGFAKIIFVAFLLNLSILLYFKIKKSFKTVDILLATFSFVLFLPAGGFILLYSVFFMLLGEG